jgi:hypothetical protein
MTRKTSLALLIALAGLACAGTASAGEGGTGFYWLAELGKVSPGNDKATFDQLLNPAPGTTGFTSSMSNGAAYDVLLGWNFNQYAAVEGGYLGTASDESYKASEPGASANANIKAEAFKLVAVGMLPLPANFTLLGKLGVAHTHINESATGTITGLGSASGSVGFSKDTVTYGVGAKYQLPSQWFIRADADRYAFNSLAGVVRRTAWAIGGGYQF